MTLYTNRPTQLLLQSGYPNAALGAVVWLVVTLILRPNPFDVAWAKLILLLAALVLVPLGLRIARARSAVPLTEQLWNLAAAIELPAALFLGIALALPQGMVAAALSLPWLTTTALIAAGGLVRVWRRGMRPIDQLCMDAGLIYIVVGGGWTVLDRLGQRPLGFEPVIVLLTAIHFHYAGFVLPVLTCLAAEQTGGHTSRFAALGVIIGVPLVAVGITLTQLGFNPSVECLAAWVTALAAMLSACLHLQLAAPVNQPATVRALWAIAGGSLATSAILAALYGSRFYFPILWLDIPWMRAVHGSANALGFGVAGLLAWNLASHESLTNSFPPTASSGRVN